MANQKLTKNHSFIRKFALFQLLLGILMIGLCFGGIALPIVNAPTQTTVLGINADYQTEMLSVMDKYFPEYKTKETFWDYFVSFELYDVKIGKEGLSFCIDRDYKIWGIVLEDKREAETRYSVYFDDKQIEAYENALALPCVTGEESTKEKLPYIENGESSDSESEE